MAIKMDNHEITTLELHSANGQTVTKQLTEDGVIPTPTGKKNITDTAETDVTNYASAQVVDANLVPENIAAGAVVLGVAGTHQGGGDIIVEALNVVQNRVYTAPQGKAYSPVIVNVQGGGGSYPSFADIYTVQEDIVDDASKGGAAKLVDLIVAAYPNFYSAVLLDEPTVDNQIVGMEYKNASYGPNLGTAESFLRYRNGAFNRKGITTTAAGVAKAGTRYLIISHETAT